MKKITSFLTIALLFGGFSTVKADLVPELQGSKRVTLDDRIGTEADLEPDQWYVVEQGRGEAGFMMDVDTLDESSVWRYKKSVLLQADGTGTTATMGAALVRFIPGTPVNGIKTFKVMFGTGRYIAKLTEWGQAVQLNADDEEEAAELFVYATKTGETFNMGCFAFNFQPKDPAKAESPYGKRVDTNGFASDRTAVTIWDEGLNDAASGNNIWTIYPVSLSDLPENEVAYSEYGAIWNEYDEKALAFPTDKLSEDRTVPGTYDPALHEAFEDLLNDTSVDDNYEDMTAEAIRQAAQAIVDAYNALIKSYVSTVMDIKPGYYYIMSPKEFYTDEEIPADNPDDQPTTVRTYINKYMRAQYSNAGVLKGGWGNMPEDATKAAYLWKISKPGTDMKFRVENSGNSANFVWSQANNDNVSIALDAESDSLMQFDYVRRGVNEDDTEQDTIFYGIRFVCDANDTGRFFNAGSHGNGAGNEGLIHVWNTGSWPSHWALVPVSDEEADAMIAAYASIKADAELQAKAKKILSTIGEDMEIARDIHLITSVDQLSSPFTEGPGKEPGSGLDKLLDADKNGTYWHSSWSNPEANNGSEGHYLQIDLDGINVENVIAEVGRRNHGYDQVTMFEVRGTNVFDAAKEDCEVLVAELPFPFTSQTDVKKLEPAIPVKGYRYLRFYATAVTGNDFRTYWHAGYFQLYDAERSENPTSQAVGMGSVYTNLEAAIEAATADGDVITKEHCNALIAAADAFYAIFVNPSELRQTISENKSLAAMVKVGNNPGEWASDATANALTKAISDATTYDAAGKYTPANSAAHIKNIVDAKEAFLAGANKVDTKKWYNISFATEKMYDDNKWDKTGADESRYSDEILELVPATNPVIYPSLFGKLVSVGREVTPATYDAAASDSNYMYVATDKIDTIAMGERLFFLDAAEVAKNADAAKFRFIQNSDTTYYIQNKATGLYLRAAGESGNVTLSVQPSLWSNAPMGYGKVITHGYDLLGRNNNYLHGQRDVNLLCTWSSTNVESNTGLLLKAVEDVAENFDGGNTVKMSLMPNAIYSMCYPVDLTPAEGQKVYGVEVSGAEITLTLFEGNKVPAGDPFVYITGTGEYDEEAKEELHVFTYGKELNAVADTLGRNHGTYFGTTAPKGSIYAAGEGTFKTSKKNAGAAIGWNSSWINAQLTDPKHTDVTYTVAEGVFDAIKDAVINVNKSGKIYRIDGTYVGKGDINSVKGLKKGLYIVNGVKVMVK